MSTLSKLQAYMAGRKALLPLSLILSAVSSIMGMFPYIFIWLIVRELLQFGGGKPGESISVYAWWTMGTAIGSIVIYFTALMLSHLAAFRVETEMRKRAMKKIINLPAGFFDTNTSGRIRKIIDDNASVTHTFLAHQMPDLVGTLLMPIVSMIMIFAFDWKFGLACLFPIVVSMLIMGVMMSKGHNFMKLYMDSLEDMSTEAVEYVRGIPVVKVFQQTVFSFKNFHNSIIKYRDMVYQYTLMWGKPMSVYTVVIHGFAYFLVPVAILIISNSGNYANVIINLIFYILITPVFAMSIMKSMHLNHAIGQAKEAVGRVENLTDIEPLSESLNPKKIKEHNISFNNVSFTYPGRKEKAIKDINISIPEGKTFALVGASGSGKTTIARLIPRFWDADEGEVKIGGIDVKDISQKELMKNISFVFQNNKLFKKSIMENISYGNDKASKDEIERALKLAQCSEIIERLPEGLDTMIGSEGTYLSGGEQQRIALARAILKDAPIIVLDEATAFTDPENEHLIQKAFGELTEGKTVLMIAHRLTSVVDADSILVMKNGKIAEQGTHEDLIKKEGVYSNLWQEYCKSVQWKIGEEAKYV